MNIIEVLTGERLRITAELTETRNRRETPFKIPAGTTVTAVVRNEDEAVSVVVQCVVPQSDQGEVVAIFPPSETKNWEPQLGCRVEWSVIGTDGQPDKWRSDPIINIYKGLL